MTQRETILECQKLVLKFFNQDMKKTTAWFGAPNPLLGEVSPNQMLEMGRHEKLLKFIESQLEGNVP